MKTNSYALLFFIQCLASVTAFQSGVSGTIRQHIISTRSLQSSHSTAAAQKHALSKYRSRSTLYNADDDNDADIPPQEENSSANKELTQEELSKKKKLAQVTGTIFNVFSYTIQFLGALFTFGLVLNLLGYGYRFDLDHGIEVNKLENIRNEIQFEREIIREEREDYLNGRGENGGFGGEQIVIGNWGKSVLGK